MPRRHRAGPRAPTPRLLTSAAQSMGIRLPSSAADRLDRFSRLLDEKAMALGLVARSDAGRLYHRHVLDCLRAAALFQGEDRLAYDLGSGAGLPGIVLAVAVPGCRFVLVEPRRIRAGFLELAIDRLELSNARVAVERAEDLRGADPGDVATARAFAPLPAAWGAAAPLLRRGGRLIYWAGESLEDPAAEGRKAGRGGAPAEVTVHRVLATSAPLVMMARK